MGKTRKTFVPPMRTQAPEPAHDETLELPHKSKKAQLCQQGRDDDDHDHDHRTNHPPELAANVLTQPDYRQDEFFLSGNNRTEDNPRRDVYEFQDSPGSSQSDSPRASKLLPGGRVREETQSSKGIGRKRKDTIKIKREVLKSIRKMQRALAQLKQQEQVLSEQ